jgi:hypothetical protein
VLLPLVAANHVQFMWLAGAYVIAVSATVRAAIDLAPRFEGTDWRQPSHVLRAARIAGGALWRAANLPLLLGVTALLAKGAGVAGAGGAAVVGGGAAAVAAGAAAANGTVAAGAATANPSVSSLAADASSSLEMFPHSLPGGWLPDRVGIFLLLAVLAHLTFPSALRELATFLALSVEGGGAEAEGALPGAGEGDPSAPARNAPPTEGAGGPPPPPPPPPLRLRAPMPAPRTPSARASLAALAIRVAEEAARASDGMRE